MKIGIFLLLFVLSALRILIAQPCEEIEKAYKSLRIDTRENNIVLSEINELLRNNEGQCNDLLSSLYRLKGNIELRLNQREAASYSFRRSLSYARSEQNSLEIAMTLNSIGKIHSWNEENDSALYYFRRSEALYLDNKNDNGLLICYQNLATTFYYIDSLEQAKVYSRKMLEKAKLLNDTEGLATGNQLLTLIDVESNGINDSTFYYYRLSLFVFKSLKDRESVMNIYENMGQGFQDLGKYDSAIHYYTLATLMADSMHSTHHMAYMNSKVTDIGALLQEKNRNKMLIIYILYCITAFAIVFTLVFFYIRKQKLIIKDKRINELMKDQEIKAIEAMLSGQDNERKRIAEELHDRLGGMLSTIKIHYNQIENQIADLQLQVREQYKKAGTLIDETVEEVRRISHDLYSGVLIKFGLKAALEQLAEALESLEKPDFRWYFHNVDMRFEHDIEINVYRVVQESIANILKHAEATEVTIQLNRSKEKLVLMIEDNGKGFEPLKTDESGIGISNIKNRTKRMGGMIDIDSTPGHGTTITINIPINYA